MTAERLSGKSRDPCPPALSVIIVNWNTRDYLRECVASLFRYPPSCAFEVIVVDNGSTDASAQMVHRLHPQVRLMANDRNLGYAKATNQGLASARGSFLLLLNPDTEMTPEALNVLLRFLLETPQAAAVAPRLRGPDGRVQLSCRTFPSPWALLSDAVFSHAFCGNRRFDFYRMGWFSYDRTLEVDQPMASCLLFRRSALEQTGGMDERFPIFFNDVDLCLRLKRAGWRLYLHPEAEILHHLGASTRQVRLRMIVESHKSLLRFYRKHYLRTLSPAVYAASIPLIVVSGVARFLLAALRHALSPAAS